MLLLIFFSLLPKQDHQQSSPKLIFQCVSSNGIRILSVRLSTSDTKHFFTKGQQRPSAHPTRVQNLIATRQNSIPSFPVDVHGVGLSPEIVRQYYNPAARQFIFRGIELLSEAVELDWFATAPVRRQRGILKREATKAANKRAKQQALADRMAAIEQALQQQASASPHHDVNNPTHQLDRSSGASSRRPTSRGASVSTARQPSGTNIQPIEPISRQPLGNLNSGAPPVHPRVSQLSTSTPIINRNLAPRSANSLNAQFIAAANEHQPANSNHQMDPASGQVIANGGLPQQPTTSGTQPQHSGPPTTPANQTMGNSTALGALSLEDGAAQMETGTVNHSTRSTADEANQNRRKRSRTSTGNSNPTP